MTIQTTVQCLDREYKPQAIENADKDGLKEAVEVLQRLIDGEIDVKELAKEIESLKHKEHIEDMAYM